VHGQILLPLYDVRACPPIFSRFIRFQKTIEALISLRVTIEQESYVVDKWNFEQNYTLRQTE